MQATRLELSELLTGFGQVDLVGTGVAGEYLSTLDQLLVLLGNPYPGHAGRNAGPTFEWDPSVSANLEMPL